MVEIECAVRDHPSITLVPAKDLVASASASIPGPTSSWTLTASVPEAKADGWTPEFAVTPDKVFGLDFAKAGRRNVLFVEADRSTMPITRRSFGQSSFKKKLLTYHHGHRAKRHAELWGIPGFRVLTIALSEERLASMISVVLDITVGKGSNVFMFSTIQRLAEAGPLGTAWVSGKGEMVPLCPTPPHARTAAALQ